MASGKSHGLFANQFQLLASLLFGVSHAWLVVLFSFSKKYLQNGEGTANIWAQFALIIFIYLCGMLIGGLSYRDTFRSRTIMKVALYANIIITVMLMIPALRDLFPILLILLVILSGMLVSLWGIYLYSEKLRGHYVQTMYLNLIGFMLLVLPINIPALPAKAGYSIAIAYQVFGLLIIGILPLENRRRAEHEILPETTLPDIYQSRNLKTGSFFYLLFSIAAGFLYTGVLPHYKNRSVLVDIIWIILLMTGYYLIYGRNLKLKIEPLIIANSLSFGTAVILFVFAPHTTPWLVLVSLGLLPICLLLFNLLIQLSYSEKIIETEANYPGVLAILLSFHNVGVIIGVMIGDWISHTRNQSLNVLALNFILILLVNIAIPFVMPESRKNKIISGTKDEEHGISAFTATRNCLPEAEMRPVVFELSDKEGDFIALEELTAREKQIASRISEGYTLQKTADELFISLNTVKYHLKNIYMKLHVTNRVEFMKRYHSQEKSK